MGKIMGKGLTPLNLLPISRFTHAKNRQESAISSLPSRGRSRKDKAYKLRDGAGLFLVIEPSGKKWWKLRVIFAKKETFFSFGEYPSVTLSQARVERDKANSQIANSIDPATVRKVAKATLSGEGSFGAVAREWARPVFAEMVRGSRHINHSPP